MSSTTIDPKPIRDLSYYQQRYRNRVFSRIVSFVAEQSHRQKMTQKDIADKIRKDPATISRILRSPSNLTLDTISDILLAFEAEAEPPEIVFFRDRPTPNYIHPLVARALDVSPSPGIAKTVPASEGEKTFKAPPSEFKIEVTTRVGA